MILPTTGDLVSSSQVSRISTTGRSIKRRMSAKPRIALSNSPPSRIASGWDGAVWLLSASCHSWMVFWKSFNLSSSRSLVA